MGRGRQKAKNTKVARELKYFSPNTDLTALQAELGTTSDEQEYEDKWADLYPEDESAEASSEPKNTETGSNDSSQ
jgi:hypothetical protein